MSLVKYALRANCGLRGRLLGRAFLGTCFSIPVALEPGQFVRSLVLYL